MEGLPGLGKDFVVKTLNVRPLWKDSKPELSGPAPPVVLPIVKLEHTEWSLQLDDVPLDSPRARAWIGNLAHGLVSSLALSCGMPGLGLVRSAGRPYIGFHGVPNFQTAEKILERVSCLY